MTPISKYSKIFLIRLKEKLKFSNEVAMVLIMARDIDAAELVAKTYFKKHSRRYDEYNVDELDSFKSSEMLFLPTGIHEKPFITF